MLYMLYQHKVAGFDSWYRIFKSHEETQKDAGLHLLFLLHDTPVPNLIVYIFKVDNIKTAKAFTETPEASEAGKILV